MDGIAQQVAQDIRSQYMIEYHSTKPMSVPGYRTIHVEASEKGYHGLRVRTRAGYFPKTGASAGALGANWSGASLARRWLRFVERVGGGVKSRECGSLLGAERVGRTSGFVEAMRTGNNVTELVGHTPMVRINRLVGSGDAELWAKLETMNPGGSIKDRAALGIVLDAERRGVLKPGDTICEATAGNTGVGLALIGVQRGYKVKIFIPEGFAEEKCILMRGLGADVVRTPESEALAGAIKRTLAFEMRRRERLRRCSLRIPRTRTFMSRRRRWRSWSRWTGGLMRR